MPAIQVLAPLVATTGVNSNIFSGSAFEYARGRTALSMGVTASGAGAFVTIQSGADVVLEESQPYVVDQYPIVPDQMFYNDIMEPFDRLRVPARNPSASPVNIRSIALLTPL